MYQQQTTEEEEKFIQQEFEQLLEDYKNSPHRKKVEIITKAFKFAHKAHMGVRRRSGEPYILHPLAVARIVIKEIGLGSTSICSALLHDVVEDTDYTVEDISNLFGPKIASIVDGLTKISGGVFGNKASLQAENFRKLLLTMSEDIRVILIKIADRLHNMRTLNSMPPAKQHKITGETQYIYAPLAQRLGLFTIKTELEDLSFKYENPVAYADIERQIKETTPLLQKTFEEFSAPIHRELKNLKYDYTLSMRLKSPYSIWKKMQKKHIPFSEVYDLLAVRIVFTPNPNMSEKEQCWILYSVLTNLYKPHPDRIRDWVNTPKANGYEALHVTVMGNGNWIEVQIRTDRMDDIAEKGLASHWKYKTGETEDSELDKWLKTIKELLEHPEPNAIDFMDTFKLNLFATEIFVFTPKGDIKTIPQGATALDFAFYLHSDIGLKCIGAKVNHKLVPLSYVLQSGDQVELLTARSQQPQSEWLNIVTTAKARTKLKSIFKKEIKNTTKRGEVALEEELKKINLSISSATMPEIMNHYKFAHTDDFFYAIGRGAIDLSEIPTILSKKRNNNRWMKIWKLQFGIGQKNEKNTTLEGADKNQTIQLSDKSNNVLYRIADCCQPIPGDDVLGIVEEDESITIHKRQCEVALKLKSSFGNRVRAVEWISHKVLSFEAILEINGIDEVGVLKEIAKIISEEYAINISKINIETKDGIFNGRFHVYVYSTEDLNNLCMNLLKIKAVKSVSRIDNNIE